MILIMAQSFLYIYKIKQIKMANTFMTSVFTMYNECNSDNYDVSDSEKDKDKDEDNNKHKENDSDIVTSTIGFNVESVNHKGINFTLWDVGGLPKIRHLWPHYYANNDAVIFVIDSQDQVRLPEAKKELAMVLEDKRLNIEQGCLARPQQQAGHAWSREHCRVVSHTGSD